MRKQVEESTAAEGDWSGRLPLSHIRRTSRYEARCPVPPREICECVVSWIVSE